jgi:HAD superfamily phosphatase (TIGR01668 family)
MDKALQLWYNLSIFYECAEDSMPFSFLPTLIAPALTDVTPQLLRQRKIRLLMLDFDNTIVPYTTSQPTPQMEAWLQQLCASEIQLCVVSNSKKDRVKVFCSRYGIDCITHAYKPSTKGIRRCLERYGIEPGQAALAGDQIFTDTLGANLAGVKPLLVSAINNHNIWLKLRHVAELPFIFIARKRRLQK